MASWVLQDCLVMWNDPSNLIRHFDPCLLQTVLPGAHGHVDKPLTPGWRIREATFLTPPRISPWPQLYIISPWTPDARNVLQGCALVDLYIGSMARWCPGGVGVLGVMKIPIDRCSVKFSFSCTPGSYWFSFRWILLHWLNTGKSWKWYWRSWKGYERPLGYKGKTGSNTKVSYLLGTNYIKMNIGLRGVIIMCTCMYV